MNLNHDLNDLLELLCSFTTENKKMEIILSVNTTINSNDYDEWLTITYNGKILDECINRRGYRDWIQNAIEYLSELLQATKTIELLMGKFNGIKIPKNYVWKY